MIKGVVTLAGGGLADNIHEFEEGFLQSGVGAGAQEFKITLSQGKRQTIKELYVWIPSHSGGKYYIARGEVGANSKLCNDIYIDAKTFALFEKRIFSDLGVIIGVNSGIASADVYVVVKYYYEE